MNKVLSFIRLDFITVKPYLTLKNFAIFSGVSLIVLMSSGASVSAISMLMVYAALYVSYPFAVGEQNGIDALYTTLSIKRSTVVLGRYLFALIIDVCAGLFSFVFSYAVLTLMHQDFNASESLVVTLVMLLLYSVIQAIQLPFYFKLGYAKAKFLTYLPFIALALFTLFITNFLKDRFSSQQLAAAFGWFVENPLVSGLIVVVIWFGIMILSLLASISYYGKRDF